MGSSHRNVLGGRPNRPTMVESPRLILARNILDELKLREARNLVAFGVFGSVAQGKDRRHSDLDLLVVLRRKRGTPRVELRQGVLVTYLPLTPDEARAEVLGAEPDLSGRLGGWRSLRPLHDPHGLLRRLRARAHRPPMSQFREAARRGLLGAYEDLGKLRNAAEAKDPDEMREMAIWFSGAAADILFCLERFVPLIHRREFVDVRRFGRTGRSICALRYENVSIAQRRKLAESVWNSLTRKATRQGIDVVGLV